MYIPWHEEVDGVEVEVFSREHQRWSGRLGSRELYHCLVDQELPIAPGDQDISMTTVDVELLQISNLGGAVWIIREREGGGRVHQVVLVTLYS